METQTTDLQPIVLKTAEEGKLSFQLKSGLQREAEERAQGIDLSSSTTILTYGTASLQKLDAQNTAVLQQVNAREAGEAGKMLVEVKTKFASFDPKRLVNARRTSNRAANFALDLIEKVPWVGPSIVGWFDEARQLYYLYKPLESTIAALTDDFNGRLVQQTAWIKRLEALAQSYLESIDALELDIAAGEIRLTELRAEYERRRTVLQGTTNIRQIQELRDFGATIRRFDQQVYNLKLARFESIVSAPTSGITKEGAESIIEIIQRTLLFLFPQFKKQLIIALAIVSQREAIEGVDAVEGMYVSAVKGTQEMLGAAQEDIKRLEGKGFVNADALIGASETLMKTIARGIELDEANQAKRRENTEKLKAAEGQLKQFLLNAGQQAAGIAPAKP